MSEHPNAALIRQGFEAFNRGDLDALSELLTPDCVQHVPGDNALSGNHEGRDAIFAMYGRIGEMTQGTFRAELEELYGTDDQVVAIYHAVGDRNGTHLDTRHALVFTMREGKASDLKEIALDLEVDDKFWAEAGASA